MSTQPVPAGRLEIQTGSAVDAIRGHAMDVSFAEQKVILTAHLYFVTVLGIEQHPVTDLDQPHAGSNGHHGGPRQPTRNLGRGRNQQPAFGEPLTFRRGDLHQNPISEHGYSELLVVGHGDQGYLPLAARPFARDATRFGERGHFNTRRSNPHIATAALCIIL
jgi:hypothetical protein